ncbi:MAG TPA: HEPN domain-containing protein [Gammaproteobacteria bacterium]|nr:HEPN domain-containing protein [Gammaproteobacteria bacterium]
MHLDILLNDFATRSFRETADGDYIAARLAYRAQLVPQFLWLSLQAIEKYLKCVLVLNRIKAPRGHDLGAILDIFDMSKKFELRLSEPSHNFLTYLDTYGRHRYYETPYYTIGGELFALDRAVWEVRRYARVLNYSITTEGGKKVDLLSHELNVNEQAETQTPHKFSIIGGHLESVLAKREHPSRAALVWQNAFYGKSHRKGVWHPQRMVAGNSPLSLHPEILDEVLKYVFLPSDVVKAYRNAS